MVGCQVPRDLAEYRIDKPKPSPPRATASRRGVRQVCGAGYFFFDVSDFFDASEDLPFFEDGAAGALPLAAGAAAESAVAAGAGVSGGFGVSAAGASVFGASVFGASGAAGASEAGASGAAGTDDAPGTSVFGASGAGVPPPHATASVEMANSEIKVFFM